MRCEEAQPALERLVEMDAADAAPRTAAGRHVARCLRCQAELAQHRRIRRELASLRSHFLEPDPDLLADILAGLDRAGDQHGWRSAVSRHRAAYVAAATAAGAAGALVIASRVGRSRLTPTG